MSSIVVWLQGVLPQVLPVVLGAGIGFVTNAIAIRMLFRPLREIRVLGIRLPFTPGIIPRQRGQLAESIGQMVSGQLLSREAVLSHIHGEGFQERIHQGLEELLHSDAGGQSDGSSLSLYLAGVIRRIATRQRLQAGLLRSVEAVQGIQIGEVVARLRVPHWVMNLINHQLSEGLGPGIVQEVQRIVDRWVRDGDRVEMVVTKELRQALVQAGRGYYEPGVDYLMEWLRRPEFRPELIRRGKTILSGILAQLTAVQRFLLSAGQYDKTLNERMPGIIDSLLETLDEFLHHEDNRERIIRWMEGGLDRVADKTFEETQRILGVDLSSLAGHGIEQILVFLRKERIGVRARVGLNRFFARHQNHSLAAIVLWASGSYPSVWAARGADALYSWLQRPLALEGLIRTVLSLIPTAPKPGAGVQPDQSVDSLQSGITRILEKTVPPLVQRFDIRSMVVNRINGLDVKDVENLLLGIMARQFKWINVFGAVLGAIIGALQLVLP
ncbi:DUF445 family protein [Spirochaeta lutea]|uniref:DUF445 family protein n=1 Tax=Spirochaeta lutea TaxID=1480694 RepID=UPI00068F2D58|nr:DUF445 family protein [Spirochaeta lutea]